MVLERTEDFQREAVNTLKVMAFYLKRILEEMEKMNAPVDIDRDFGTTD